jgi:predicted RNase H-like HicB family nuclease
MRECTIVLDPDPNGRGFTVTVPVLPGCITQGRTKKQAVERAREAILLLLESVLAHGEEIPGDVPDVQIQKVAV